ncbi:transcriptional repressor LexA [Leptodesmis sichuanensis]|uniref:transcriptional repressor LexA n=1 Tax=Leptodesmis sichuanensis TaxID=2906798 RepID=UPI001F3A6B36|nr:transcriptional repressor LexA [Leptodesmis sichuanensis]UIE38778.1 transcriptional repressor LexA [Leptodesmis sichuanensis A121]
MDSLTEAQQELYDWLVEYIRENQYPPSIRQMMKAMGLKSPAPVQSRLEHLRSKGYIQWTEGKARTIQLTQNAMRGVPIKGVIAAGSLVDVFPDAEVEYLDLAGLSLKPNYFALQVRGDSMVDAMIDDGDIVILKPVPDPKTLKNGTIVAARVENQTTLKYFHRKGGKVTLEPANKAYQPIEVPASQVEIQGALVHVWRDYSA